MQAARWSWVLLLVVSSCRAGAPAVPDGWVDRIEGDVAVVVVRSGDWYEERDVPLEVLPVDVTEGDVLVDGQVDLEATDALARRVREAQERLFRARP